MILYMISENSILLSMVSEICVEVLVNKLRSAFLMENIYSTAEETNCWYCKHFIVQIETSLLLVIV